MRVTGDFATDCPQAETLGRVVTGGLEPSVIKHQPFRAPPLEKQLSVIGTRDCAA